MVPMDRDVYMAELLCNQQKIDDTPVVYFPSIIYLT